MTPAPDPNFAAVDVISMFSNVYTNVSVDTWQTSWSQGTLNDIQIQGNDTKKYSGLNFVGVETTGSNILNVSGMTHLYLNVWTANMTEFRVKLVDFGNNLSYAGGDDSEHELSFTPTLESWMTLDIPLTNFVNLSSNDHIAQLIFSGNPAGSGVVYVDNVLYHTTESGIESLQENDSHLYPNPVQNELIISHPEELAAIQIYSLTGECILVQSEMSSSKLDVSQLENGVYICLMESLTGEIRQEKFIKE
jgi:hypothetical protein